MPYALLDRDKQIDRAFPTEKEAWEHALTSGLVLDVPVADEAGGQMLPAGYRMRRIADDETFDPAPEWKLPKAVS